jgi:magnesium chelatase family protein
LREVRDRIRSAIVNSGESWPLRRVTVGMSLASPPKRGSGVDISISASSQPQSGPGTAKMNAIPSPPGPARLRVAGELLDAVTAARSLGRWRFTRSMLGS